MKKKFKVYSLRSKVGFTLVDVLVGTFLILIVFLGIFGAYQLGLKVVGLSKNKITATAIANQQIEMIRNLPYGSVGTKGAKLPYAEGVLDSATTAEMDKVKYDIEIKVKFIPDDKDGLDEPECDWDYKRVEVKVSWSGRFGREVKLATDIAPKNKAEELAACQSQPGGILSVSVFVDDSNEMVSSPLIKIFDPITQNLVDSYSPPTGKYDSPLATSTYKVVVSKSGFNSARTYGTDEVAIPENTCYARPHQIILEGQSMPVSFCIAETSVFSVDTLSPWGSDYWADSFNDASKISSSSNVMIGGGKVELATDTEGYLVSGFLISTSVSPTNLISWDEFSFTDSEPMNTDLKYQIYYASGTEWILIPDSVLPGNLNGFDDSPVNLSGLATTTYSQLKLRGNLSTNSTSFTPTLFDWQVSWIASQPTPVPGANFQLRGNKIIGLDINEDPVYKYSIATSSDSNGHKDLSDLEWDNYYFSVNPASGLDLVDTNPSPQPIFLPPNTTSSVKLYLDSQNSLLVTAQNIETLEPVFSATVRLYNSDLGYDAIQYTNAKGQTYFIPLEAATYNLEIQAAGYLATSTQVSVSGDEAETIKLEPLE